VFILEPPALDSFQLAHKLAPVDPIVVEEVAIGMLNQGQHQQASDMLQKAIDRGSNSAQIFYYLGLSLQNQGSTRQAIESYDRAIQLRPQDIQINQARVSQGILFYSVKEVDKSIAAFKAALLVDPTDAAAHGNLGGIQANAGALDEAAQSFEKAVNLGDEGAKEKLVHLRRLMPP
jgi:tetratricopeptide (TPR) repeat protein